VVTIVVPFRAGGKSRLPDELRVELALAMLGDVVEAASAVGAVWVVTDDTEAGNAMRALDATVVSDPGGGQGRAVDAGLTGRVGRCLVVNADLPCATSDALVVLAAQGPALVAAADGTTNALSLPEPRWFEPLYGPGSAARFAAAGLADVSIPELEHDVDTLPDLLQLPLPAGRRTTLLLNQHRLDLERV
jgi:2-phospho-L-lactate guanylyltransferase